MRATLAPLLVAPTDVCDNAACTGAYSHRDTCECTRCVDGAGHGIQYRIEAAAAAARTRARILTSGDVFLGAANTVAHAPVSPRTARPTWCVDCMNVADDCYC